MIRYNLTCEKDHHFDGWFASANGFESLLSAGQVTCIICGSASVEKALMAPAVTPGLTVPRNTSEQALAAMRRKVETESEYVGPNFAREARAIHTGDAPERSIYGEARFEEAKALIEDGVPVAPLPFTPTRKAN